MERPNPEGTLGVSWHDTAWIPHLSQANVLDYFSDKSNPFYDRTCNNETIKMQRLNPDQLLNMTGLEYSLLHAQEPILYVIRKQNRLSPQHVTPIADYYILAGRVYQGPDLCTVVNSRLLNTLHHIQSAFDEALTYARFHPSRGYSWEFKEKEEKEPATKDKQSKKKEEASSKFQRQRVDLLLGELAKKHPPLFPPPAPTTAAVSQSATPQPAPVPTSTTTSSSTTTTAATTTTTVPQNQPVEVKTEPIVNGNMRPPPEKKQKLR